LSDGGHQRGARCHRLSYVSSRTSTRSRHLSTEHRTVQLTDRIGEALEQHTAWRSSVVMDHRSEEMVHAIPGSFLTTQRCGLFPLCLEGARRSHILDRLPIKLGVDELNYTPGGGPYGASIAKRWQDPISKIVSARQPVQRSHPYAHTLRQLNDLTATATRR